MNSKKNNRESEQAALPVALESALAAAQNVLAKHDRFAAALAETGGTISGALASERQLSTRLGAAELAGSDDVPALRAQLSAVAAQREAAIRGRHAATQGLADLGEDLRRARAAVEQARARYAASVVSEFHARWSRCSAELVRLHAEGVELSRVLRFTVACAPPYCAAINVVSQRAEVRLIASPEPVAVDLPPGLQALAAIIGRLDAADGVGAGVRQAAELNVRHHALSRLRAGQQIEMTGVFVVTKPFSILGSTFEVGALLDRSILPDGLLHRFWIGRHIRPLEGFSATGEAA
jgi:hypothetical protein